MAKLIEVYKNNNEKLAINQLPLTIDDNLTMVMDVSAMALLNPQQLIKTKDLDKFLEMYNLLDENELRNALQVYCKEYFVSLSRLVPCVGCRRSVERLYDELCRSGDGHLAVDPLLIKPDGSLTLRDDHFQDPRLLFTLFHGHSTRLNKLLETQQRSRRSRRCVHHSLEYPRVRTHWLETWDKMNVECRQQVLVIDAKSLMTTLECYLQKHRFCGDCRTKLLKAYWLLVEAPEPTREKGYVAALYAGIKRCLPDKHIHLPSNLDYVTTLINRVQPDIMASGGERHAKTMEIAQNEVLTCLALCIYERLLRIQVRLKEEEHVCQVLVAVAIDTTTRKFQMAVDMKRGTTELDLLYKQLTKEESARQLKKEQKKLKKRKKRERKAVVEEDIVKRAIVVEEEDKGCGNCDHQEDQHLDLRLSDEFHQKCCCKEIDEEICTNCQDGGYSSGNAGSRKGSACRGHLCCRQEVMCKIGDQSELFSSTSHPEGSSSRIDRFTLSLAQMLEDSTSSDEEGVGYIPVEEVQEFHSRINVAQKREELRKTLRMRFAQLCVVNQNVDFSDSSSSP